MKRIIILAMGFIPAQLWAQSGNFIVTAKIGQFGAPAKAYLRYQAGDKVVMETAVLDKGAFRFTGTVTEPTIANLALAHLGEDPEKLGPGSDILTFVLEKGNINLTAKDSVKVAVITGSKVNGENKIFLEATATAQSDLAKINAEYASAPELKKSDKTFQQDLQERASTITQNLAKQQREFIKQNPDSYVSLMAIMEQSSQSQELDFSTFEPLYKSLSAGVRNTPTGIEFGKTLQAAQNTAVGSMAPLFTQNDVNDKPVSLSDFRGKYVLLDFWASWCTPCRKENPNVVKAYNEFKDKNFTVLGVSLDRPGKKEDWLAAIKSDGLTWTQVSDLKFWSNDVAKLYGIKAIPKNYLIDPTGKIIGKNLRGEELNRVLASLLN